MNATVCRSPHFIEGRNAGSPTLAALPRQVIDTLYVWQQRSVDRRNLMTMSHHQLVDIGIDRAEAWREASKPFWKP